MAFNNKDLLLVPAPKSVEFTAGTSPITGAQAGADIQIDPGQIGHAQGYRLEIDNNGVRITAHDDAGAYYARQTLAQIVLQCKDTGVMPCLCIEDHPDYKVRGVMLDISRDKVPTMQTLFTLMDRFAAWKINQVQLYTEHTFAYKNHEKVWRDSSPFTADQIQELDAYCRERHIELVPNQNSFGHMHRWLKHDEYKHLAECADGWDDPWNERRTEPFSLCPVEPDSIRFLEGLYDELLPNFTSRLFNVGLDETYEIGQGKSKAACDEHGTGRVYLDFLKQVHAAVKQRGRTMMFWGDIILQHPTLVGELPTDAIVLEWGYELGHDFDGRCAKFAESGLSFYVCPGTSSWNTALGRTHNMLSNIAHAAKAGRTHGACGFLNTDWGDNGHTQPLTISYPGFLYGAAVSWSIDSHDTIDLPRALDLFVFEDRMGVMGQAVYDLGNTYRLSGQEQLHNCTIMFEAIWRVKRSKQQPPFNTMDAGKLRETLADIQRIAACLVEADMACSDAHQVRDELGLAIDLARHGLHLAIAFAESDCDYVADLPGPIRDELRNELLPLRQRHKSVWLGRNRPGGLHDSLLLMRRALSCYQSGELEVTVTPAQKFPRIGTKQPTPASGKSEA